MPLSDSPLVLRRTFPASRERVFDAWIEASALQKWFQPMGMQLEKVTVNARAGGNYRLDLVSPAGEKSWIAGQYVEVDPPQKLVFTWESSVLGNLETLVTVEFLDHGAQTEIILTHERLEAEMIDRHRMGWSSCLDLLTEVL